MIKLLISAGALAALALSTPAFAAANQATADATVNIVSPLSLENVNAQKLDFGTIVGPFNGETVEVTSGGVRTCGGLTCSGTVSAAAFRAYNGTPGQNLVLTVDPSVTLTGPGANLIVDLTGDLPSGLVTDINGESLFGIGGKLTIPSGQADGVYTGTFNVQVDYQ